MNLLFIDTLPHNQSEIRNIFYESETTKVLMKQVTEKSDEKFFSFSYNRRLQ